MNEDRDQVNRLYNLKEETLMRKILLMLMSVILAVSLLACGDSGNSDSEEFSVNSGETGSSDKSDYELPGENEEDDVSASSGDIAPMVQIDGVLYRDTGYISSAVGCGVQDGQITSTVDGSEYPSVDSQSNFGTGYGYQIAGDDLILVNMNEHMEIFRDINSDDNSIPMQVASFIARVAEDRGSTLLVSYEGMPDNAVCIPQENGAQCKYIVSVSNADEDIHVGDEVIVWYTGFIEKTDPAQIDAYKISKHTDNM